MLGYARKTRVGTARETIGWMRELREGEAGPQSGSEFAFNSGLGHQSLSADCHISGPLDVTGNVGLDGTMDIEILHGPGLFAGELFDVIDFTGTETGTLSRSAQEQQNWTVIYGANQVDLEFGAPVTTHGVPDAGATVLLLGAAITCLGVFARTRRWRPEALSL